KSSRYDTFEGSSHAIKYHDRGRKPSAIAVLPEDSILARLLRRFLIGAISIAATAAWGNFHTFVIDQAYSNADGTVQFVVLRESQGTNGENLWSGHAFTSTHAGVTKSFTFPADLPGTATAGKRVLIGTQGLAALG